MHIEIDMFVTTSHLKTWRNLVLQESVSTKHMVEIHGRRDYFRKLDFVQFDVLRTMHAAHVRHVPQRRV